MITPQPRQYKLVLCEIVSNICLGIGDASLLLLMAEMPGTTAATPYCYEVILKRSRDPGLSVEHCTRL